MQFKYLTSVEHRRVIVESCENKSEWVRCIETAAAAGWIIFNSIVVPFINCTSYYSPLNQRNCKTKKNCSFNLQKKDSFNSRAAAVMQFSQLKRLHYLTADALEWNDVKNGTRSHWCASSITDRQQLQQTKSLAIYFTHDIRSIQ